MIPMHLVIKGNPIVKKNTMHTTWFKNVIGAGGVVKKVPLEFPIKYYSKQYMAWAKKAVEQVLIWKNTHIQPFPINEPVIITVVFFLAKDYKVDLSNLVEGIQDVLTGASGLNTSKTLQHKHYQVLTDDSHRYFKLENMVAFIDAVNPRMEVFISPYNPKAVGDILRGLHPELKMTLGHETQTLFSEAFPTDFLSDIKWETKE